MKNIVSFSGGKDSTAMLLMMLEKGMQVDEIIFCDTGMEFPFMYQHIKQVEKYIKMPIKIIKSDKTFEYYLGSHVKKNGNVGYGFPDFKNRWCTTLLKQNLMRGRNHQAALDFYHNIYFYLKALL